MSASPTEGTDMHQIEKVARAIVEAMYQEALTDEQWAEVMADGAPLMWGAAAIAAMQPAPQEPVAWLYTDRTNGRRMVSLDMRSIPACAETPLYAHPPAPQWQGIESAPRDGKAVLLWVPADDGWDAYVASGWYESGVFDRRWYAAMDEKPLSPQPTHWMPLPTPPAGGSDAE